METRPPRFDAARSPTVSVVMPVKDEGAYLDTAIRAVQAQTYPSNLVDVYIVDGGSTDATTSIAAAAAVRDPRIHVLGGAGVNCPTGMNLGIAASSGEIVAKIDGHGYIDARFIEAAVERLGTDPRIGCVGGQIVPLASTDVANANRIARFSMFGIGAGVYTAAPTVRDVETVQCGVYRRPALERAGLFDPDLQFGEDEELNHRLRASGARVVYEPAMRFYYQVRPTISGLFRQYRNYGRARVQVVRRHHEFLKVKHTVPAVLVLSLVVGIVLLATDAQALGLLVIGAYMLGLIAAAAYLAIQEHFRRPDLIAISLACLHLGYGIGTWIGLADLLRRPSAGARAGQAGR